MADDSFDILVIGGGILGLATALRLLSRAPQLKLAILEKEPQPALHQTRHNSGVLHSGLYYLPRSLKARLCIRGAELLLAYCNQRGIPILQCGKVVVATTRQEVPPLHALYRKGLENGVRGLTLIGPDRLKELEPHAQGVAALHVPSTAVVDFSVVARDYARRVQERGASLRTACRALRSRRQGGKVYVETSCGAFEGRFLINCGGLQADRIAQAARDRPGCRILPFRGEYLELAAGRAHLVRGLVYPVPDPQLPFLGVHLTRTIDGRVEAGPNAVLALKREGYRKWDFDLADAWSSLSYPGFWRMVRRHGWTGLREWGRSLDPRLFLKAVRRLVPDIQSGDLLPAGSGIRAQALDVQGHLLDDFRIVRAPRTLHLVNAPSPAATASLAIGEEVARQVLSELSPS